MLSLNKIHNIIFYYGVVRFTSAVTTSLYFYNLIFVLTIIGFIYVDDS